MAFRQDAAFDRFSIFSGIVNFLATLAGGVTIYTTSHELEIDMASFGPIAQQIKLKLTRALDPVELEIEDDSHRHVGHAGHDGAGESHFNVRIVADRFAGKSRLDRQRLVYDALSEELAGRVHALSIRALTSDEAGRAVS